MPHLKFNVRHRQGASAEAKSVVTVGEEGLRGCGVGGLEEGQKKGRNEWLWELRETADGGINRWKDGGRRKWIDSLFSRKGWTDKRIFAFPCQLPDLWST